MNSTELKFENMKQKITNAGGLFYQYRPCRRDGATIYDIENIRHGVVYAQTTLNMNDPFDSMIGYSPEKIYEECIDMVIKKFPIKDENLKVSISQLFKYKELGKLTEFICILNELKKYLFSTQVIMHQTNIPIALFINQNLNTLYAKCPNKLKNILEKKLFAVFLLLVSEMETVDITEENLSYLFKLDMNLNELYEKIIEIKDNLYIPSLRAFLSKITISCFSASGWDNQLMWSHYANSYAGICVEYDFNQIKEHIGFIYPVKYTTKRPTLSLHDLDIEDFDLASKIDIKLYESKLATTLSYLLTKNICWDYEKEWRIINIGKENTPLFIDLPFVKSITFGMNIDPICRHLLWDICQEREIECYEIVPEIERFELNRKKLTKKDFAHNINIEIKYINRANFR